MKRLTVLILFAVVAVFAISAKSFVDGKYFAQDATFESNGWKSQMILEVKGGKIVSANWNGVSNIALIGDKKAYDKAGKYNMVKFGKAKSEWYQQAEAIESYLIKTQDIEFSKYTNAEGSTDAISGASIHVKPFFELAKKAIAAGPVPKGMYSRDGWFYAEQSAYDKKTGWKDTILITVVNGSIVDAVWNGASNDKSKKSKIIESTTGNYGLVKIGKAKAEWYEQAAKAEAALVRTQDPLKIAVRSDGKTDAISGVSITVSDFLKLASEALKAAK